MLGERGIVSVGAGGGVSLMLGQEGGIVSVGEGVPLERIDVSGAVFWGRVGEYVGVC